MNDWRPIETAPKDEWFLGVHEKSKVMITSHWPSFRREWFRFKQEDMPAVFATASKEFVRVVGKQPEWRTITEAQAMEYLVQTKSKARARAA